MGVWQTWEATLPHNDFVRRQLTACGKLLEGPHQSDRMERRMPKLTGVLETALDVDDLNLAIDFYHRTLELQIIDRSDRFCAFSVAGHDVLLLFQREAVPKAVDIPGGRIPPHGSRGSIHLAFSLERSELAGWEERLASQGVAVESRVSWERGGTSVYFRDPDGHLLELATPGVWSIY